MNSKSLREEFNWLWNYHNNITAQTFFEEQARLLEEMRSSNRCVCGKSIRFNHERHMDGCYRCDSEIKRRTVARLRKLVASPQEREQYRRHRQNIHDVTDLPGATVPY